MNSQEIATYFRTLTSEGDFTFLDNTKLSVLLANAHREFRRLVTKVDESNYETDLTVTPTSDSYSLNGTLFGSPATHRATRISRITWATSTPGAVLVPCSSYETLLRQGDTAWWLQGQTLRFNRVITSPIKITYITAMSLNWLAGITAPTFFEEVCEEFGDIIALLAYQAYKVQDYQENPYQVALLSARLSNLRDYLGETRSGGATNYVHETGW